MVRINNPTDYIVVGAEMRITSNYGDMEMNQWDRTMRLLLKRIEELEKRVEKLEKPYEREPEFPKYDGDGKPLDIHGNEWNPKSTYDGSENH